MVLAVNLFLAILFLWVLYSFFIFTILGDENHNLVSWFLAVLLRGTIGVPAAVGLSDRLQRRYLRLFVEIKGIDLEGAKISGSKHRSCLIMLERWGD